MVASVKNSVILAAAALVVALPFIFQRRKSDGDWRPGDPVLVVVSPHFAAIRDEFGAAFSDWHREKYGQPARIDWRAIGGTTEIMRYLASEYASAFRAWWRQTGHELPRAGGEVIFDKYFVPDVPPETDDPEERQDWERRNAAWKAFRASDNPAEVHCGIDVFFGGGTYDHGVAARQGITVVPWEAGEEPEGLLTDSAGNLQLLPGLGGESWRTPYYYTAVLATFGICYNPDRLRDLGIANEPKTWRDLVDFAYFGQIGVTDPTKSGSIAKAFETIIHSECHRVVREAGYSLDDVRRFEAAIAKAKLPPGQVPDGVPAAYQEAVERGWISGVNTVRLIGANARYFTDGAGKVSIDTASGDTAAGISIDFYSRVQAEVTRSADGVERLKYITPFGGSSGGGDPISLLRGAPHRELGRRLMEFVLSTDGQKLWNYRPGEPGGPRKHALRRLPVRREFYASDDPAQAAVAAEHARHTSDPLTDPSVDVFKLSGAFEYVPRWTSSHFSFFRILVRSMCMDAGEELRAAWKAVNAAEAAGADASAARAQLLALPDVPEPMTWRSAGRLASGDTMDVTREWTRFFRNSYAKARRLAEEAVRAKASE